MSIFVNIKHWDRVGFLLTLRLIEKMHFGWDFGLCVGHGVKLWSKTACFDLSIEFARQSESIRIWICRYLCCDEIP